MFKKFKKILVIATIVTELVCFAQVLHADDWSQTIETSVGPKTLVLPEGMTFKEAYVEMAKLYLEEKADYEELIKQTEDLMQKSKDFEAVSLQLESLQDELSQKNAELNELYKKLNRTHPLNFLVTAGVSTDLTFSKLTSMQVAFGVELFEGWLLMLEAGYPLSFSFKTGIRF